ncbi:hypothetical protein FA15DRAFT_602808, partial [Coprinopsis marcescibilis]
SNYCQDNIKSYVIAILLSPKLGLYKGGLPQDWVLAVIKTLKVNVPANMDSNCHVFKIIKEAVSNELTQAQLKIKKAVSKLVQSSTPTNCVSIACQVLTMQRKVHAELAKANSKYWDHVNDRLALIHDLAAGEEEKVQQEV